MKDERMDIASQSATRCLFRLINGNVSVKYEIMGETITVHHAAPGDWLIEPGFCISALHPFAISEGVSTLLEVPASDLADSLVHEPDFASAWCKEIGMQMARAQRRSERLNCHKAVQRVTHYLLTESTGNCGELVLPYPKNVWASHLGMAPETLSRTLSEMISSGRLEELHGKRYRLLPAQLT